jgi:hypothetical protein
MLATTGIGTSYRSPKPNASAWLRSTSSPRSMPIAPNVVLQDFSRARLIVVVWLFGVQVPLK